MEIVLYYKFTQHKKLKRELLGTRDLELIEVQFWFLEKFSHLIGKDCRTRKQIRSGGVGQTGLVGMSLGRHSCGFVSSCENRRGDECFESAAELTCWRTEDLPEIIIFQS